MERRQFIKNTILGGVTSFVMPPSNIFSLISDNNEQTICWNGSVLPLLFETDVLIIGGGFCGLSAVVNFIAAGKKVAVIDSKTFLGDEITAYMDFAMDIEDTEYPEPINICKEYSVINNGHRYVKNDDIKRELEIMLMRSGVPLLYNTLPVHIDFDGLKNLIVVANKSGFQLVEAKVIIDCTHTGVTKYLTGDINSLRLGENISIVVEMYGNRGTVNQNMLRVPDYLKINNNQLNIIQGYLNDGHLFLRFSGKLSDCGGKPDIRRVNKAEVDIRIQAYDVVKYLVNNVPQFEGAAYSRLSYYTKIDFIEDKSNIPSWAKNKHFNKEFNVSHKTYKLNHFAGKYPNTWVLPPYKFDYSAVISAFVGDQLSKSLSNYVFPDTAEQKQRGKKNEDIMLDLHCSDSQYEGKIYKDLKIDSFNIHLLDEYQVIVAGGGTSGATAGAVAGSEGLKTIIVDSNNGLGGTGTFGGVNTYWYGREAAFSKEIDSRVVQAEKEIKYFRDPPSYIWNMEVKNYVLMKDARAASTDMIFHSIVVGAIMKGADVKGIVIATLYGVYAVTSKLIIDATGEGDVAAFAGAEYVYGSAANVFPLYSSFQCSEIPGRFSTKFAYMVDTRDVSDITRSIIANRLADKEKPLYDHATFLTSRESRHILGETVISLTDQLVHKQWRDVVNIHFSNNDIKGHHSSDWFRIGLIPPNLEVEIPLGALTPKAINNILVVGKAFSAKHDAFPTVRMQRDLENLGGVAALICNFAIKSNRGLRELDIEKLQRILVERDILHKEIINRKIPIEDHKNTDIPLLISQLDGNKPLYSYSDMDKEVVFRERIPFVDICLLKDKAVPMLEQAMADSTDNKKLIIAKALAFIGAKSAVDVIANQIRENIKHGVLPERTEKIRHILNNILPNQAGMPETAYLLNALAMCRDKRSIEIWKQIVEILNPTESDLRSQTKGTFYYVDAICYGAELLGDPEAIPILRKLHQYPLFYMQYSSTTLGMNYMNERKSMLELEIGTALARSGSKEGFEILVNYLDDNRAILAEYAHHSLKLISSENLGKDKDMWQQWLRSIGDMVIPSPLQRSIDG